MQIQMHILDRQQRIHLSRIGGKKIMACGYSHYEAKQGYICAVENKPCQYNPPNFKKCVQDFHEKIKQHKAEGK